MRKNDTREVNVMNTFEFIVVIIYWIAGYWAVNKVWYSRRNYIVYDGGKFLVRKGIVALFLGWLAIPIAIIMMILKK